MSAQAWTHDSLVSDLAAHLRSSDRMVWADMQLGPSGSPRPDVYVMPKSFVHFVPMAYEVKVSLSDFRADVTAGKWQAYLQYAAGVTFACPSGLLTKEMLPAGCGLMLRGETWRTVRKATLSPVTLNRDAWLKLLIDGVERASRTRRSQEAAHWRTEEGLRRKFGDEVGRLLARAVSAKEIITQAEARAAVIVESARKRAEESIRRESDEERSAREAVAALVGRDPSVGWLVLAAAVRRMAAECSADARVRSMRYTLDHIAEMAGRASRESHVQEQSS